MHPDIRAFFKTGWGLMLKLNGIFFFVFLILLDLYPMPLISFDAAIVVYSLCFAFFFFAFQKGKITAYYRKSYTAKDMFPLYFILHGAWVRTMFILAYWRINEALALKQGRKDSFVLHASVHLFDPFMWGMALVVFLFVVYIIFYKDGWIRIDAFAKEVREQKKHVPYSTKQTEWMVLQNFLQEESSFFIHLKKNEPASNNSFASNKSKKTVDKVVNIEEFTRKRTDKKT